MSGRAPSPLLLLNLAVWGALALAPLGLGAWQVGQLAQYFTYGLFAMSLALIWGHCGLLCFGQAVFFGLGAYAMSLVTLGMVPGLEAVPSSYLGMLCAVLLPAGFVKVLPKIALLVKQAYADKRYTQVAGRL